MSITQSGATVDTTERDALLSSTVDAGVTSGGATLNTGGVLGLGGTTGANLAGVTASFASNVSTAIDEYCAEIDAKIEELSQVEVNTAFKGSAIESALNNFIESVKTTAKSYTNKLKEAETQIVNSVAKAYETQDTDISGNLASDGSTLESNIIS